MKLINNDICFIPPPYGHNFLHFATIKRGNELFKVVFEWRVPPEKAAINNPKGLMILKQTEVPGPGGEFLRHIAEDDVFEDIKEFAELYGILDINSNFEKIMKNESIQGKMIREVMRQNQTGKCLITFHSPEEADKMNMFKKIPKENQVHSLKEALNKK